MIDFFKKKPKKSLPSLQEDVEIFTKKGKTDEQVFLKDFLFPHEKPTYKFNKESKKNYDLLPTEPKKLSDAVIKDLKSSIVISLEFFVYRDDLEFICISRVDGRPIYKYVGNNFSNFELPYDECFSIGGHIGEDNIANYTDYLIEHIDRTISYSEYVAESLGNYKFGMDMKHSNMTYLYE